MLASSRTALFALALATLWTVSTVSACAPMTAATAINGAEAAIEQAEDADAERYAAYEYWLAKAYLRKAKLTDGYSEFRAAERFAAESRAAADKAVEAATKAKVNEKVLRERTGGQAPRKAGPK